MAPDLASETMSEKLEVTPEQVHESDLADRLMTLLHERLPEGHGVEAKAADGSVVLSGKVTDPKIRAQAEALVRGYPEVVSVLNRISS